MIIRTIVFRTLAALLVIQVVLVLIEAGPSVLTFQQTATTPLALVHYTRQLKSMWWGEDWPYRVGMRSPRPGV